MLPTWWLLVYFHYLVLSCYAVISLAYLFGWRCNCLCCGIQWHVAEEDKVSWSLLAFSGKMRFFDEEKNCCSVLCAHTSPCWPFNIMSDAAGFSVFIFCHLTCNCHSILVFMFTDSTVSCSSSGKQPCLGPLKHFQVECLFINFCFCYLDFRVCAFSTLNFLAASQLFIILALLNSISLKLAS